MDIYLLKLINNEYRGWADEARGFIVIAGSAGMARILAAAQAGDEGPETWHDPDHSSCQLIGITASAAIFPAGQQAHIVLRDFYGV